MKLNSPTKKNNKLLNENEKQFDSKNFNAPNHLSNNILKYVWIIAGVIFVCFGILGIILPVLPTTPFLLLAAFCFGKSSKKFYCWLLNNKWITLKNKNHFNYLLMDIFRSHCYIFNRGSIWQNHFVHNRRRCYYFYNKYKNIKTS